MQCTSSIHIEIPTRQRRERPRGFIDQLKQSIISKGLMHPVVLSLQEKGEQEVWVLVAGESRFIAMSQLHTDGIPFKCNGALIPVGQIPYVRLGDLTADDLAEAELQENIIRANLTWQEEAEAKVLIFKLRQKQDPSFNQTDMAKEIVETDETTTVQAEQSFLQRALMVQPHMHKPRVRAAKTLKEATKVVLDEMENNFKANLLQSGAVQSNHKLIKGDALEVLPKLPAGQFDAIIVDPPYGIDADKYRTPTKEAGEKKFHGGHHYQDSQEYSDRFCEAIFKEGFRLLRPRGIIFLFCDPDRFHSMRDMAARMAFSCWRTPIIWHKQGQQSAFAPWGSGGFVRSYEMLLFATKGQKILAIPGGPDVLSFARVSVATKVHAAEKPVELLTHLLQRACIPGDKLLDPCCGSGSIFAAADAMKVSVTGIEIDEVYHEQAAARLVGEVK